MSDATLTFRVDEALKSEFSQLAKTLDRTSAQLLRSFMRDLIRQQHQTTTHDSWFREQVRIGIDSADHGNLIPHSDVEAEFALRRAETSRMLTQIA
jgi:predicted transcriptional regulator